MTSRDDHVVVRPSCANCGEPATLVELVPPGEFPHDWAEWAAFRRDGWLEYHDTEKWRLIFAGIEGYNGTGDDIAAERAELIAAAFREPLRYERVRAAGFYDDAGFCAQCELPYCSACWSPSTTGYGTCRAGHGRSLDPHWSPS